MSKATNDIKDMKTTLKITAIIMLIAMIASLLVMALPVNLCAQMSSRTKMIVELTFIGSSGISMLTGFIYSELN